MILISVIIPLFNAANSIKRCINSVLNQDFAGPIEIIVINDGSTDTSAQQVTELMEAYRRPDRKILLISQQNGGVSKARNTGLKIAEGSLIAMLDADDEWAQDKLSIQLEVLESNPEIDFLGCARNNEPLVLMGKRIDTLHCATVLELLVKMYPQTSTAIFKKSLLNKVGLYDEKLTHGEDGDLWIRLCAAGNFWYDPRSLVITGDGKPSFGHSGLSANLKAMQWGCEANLMMAKRNGYISLPLYTVLYLYGKMKYIRRILITKARKNDL